MLHLTARYADAWNTAWYGAPDDRLDRQLSSLADVMDAEGRDAVTLTKTVGIVVRDPATDVEDESEFTGSVDELARVMDAYATLGVDHLIVLLQPLTEPSLDRLHAALKVSAGHR